ncbi:IS3 family transposase [Acidiplasma aeolicum]|uniref:IS3 family transposase n=1 Tax=Acidiplasma aeolicum TaxID=507754 RepID=UPI00371D641E
MKKHIKHRISDEIINGNRLGGKTTYGYTRIWTLLRNSGININRKTVYKIIKQFNTSSAFT